LIPCIGLPLENRGAADWLARSDRWPQCSMAGRKGALGIAEVSTKSFAADADAGA